MAYQNLNITAACDREHSERLNLQEAVVRFIRETCENLRCDETIEKREKEKAIFYGRSISQNQIPYNQEKDTDRLCLENAMDRFMQSGSKQDAFDVYFCYLEMFIGNYSRSRRMIEMLSEFEMNGSSLLMKHRDHYQHSVYVFALGLAVFETSPAYQDAYMKFYGFESKQKAAHHFIEFWGLASLFHDIGYPFELPFEQVESYFEVKGEKRRNNPFVAYLGMERFTAIGGQVKETLKKVYGKSFSSTSELFAYDIAKKLKQTYHVTKESLGVVLETKPSSPDRFGYFMDHAYFSASILFQEMYGAYSTEEKLSEMQIRSRTDAMTAILLHNSFYKFSIAFYKDDRINVPLKMELHPLAYLLMLCDELQCWDRTSYGRNSRTELHPYGCRFAFAENTIAATYLYDKNEEDKIKKFRDAYAQWDHTSTAPKLKAYSGMVLDEDSRLTTEDAAAGDSVFLSDIKKIVDTSRLNLTVSVDMDTPDYSGKKAFLSDSNFIHLYDFAVVLNGRYNYITEYGNDEEFFEKTFNKKNIADMEESFGRLSLEYKLSNIGQAKAFAEYLNAVDLFYTDKPVDFELVTSFAPEEMAVFGPMEHGRWLKEHIEMGWSYGEPDRAERDRVRQHKDMIPPEIMEQEPAGVLTEEKVLQNFRRLNTAEQEKDTKPLECMLKLIKHFDGLRIYRIRPSKNN